MEPGTDSPVEDHDTSDDEVPKGYRRKCLPPEMPISTHSFIQNSGTSGTHQLSPIASIELASSYTGTFAASLIQYET